MTNATMKKVNLYSYTVKLCFFFGVLVKKLW